MLNRMYRDILSFETQGSDKVVFIDPQGCVVIIGNGDSGDGIETMMSGIQQEMKNRYEKAATGRLDCYVGLQVDDIMKLRDSFKSASRLNVCGVLTNESGLYLSEDILFRRANNRYDYLPDMNEWIRAIIFGDENATETISRIFDRFAESGYLLTDLRVAATRMVDTLSKEMKLVNRVTGSDGIGNMERLDDLEIRSGLEALTKRLTEETGRTATGKDTYIAIKAIEYIEKNYNDSNIDLQQVCGALNVSVSYFSGVFKRHTKMTFVKYLNNYRIEKAKYHLEYGSDTVAEISESVGYLDPHYFGIVFKKYTGMTPKNTG